MHLSSSDLDHIMRNFPRIKLSYVKNIHKKVSSANLFLAIPKGIKYFVWFKHFKNNPICLFLEIDRRRHNIKSISIKNTCFSNKLCIGKGTILYGTMFLHNDFSFFTFEDIFMHKGRDISEYDQINKWKCIKSICNNNISQTFLSKKDVILGLPVISNTRDEMETNITNISYPIYCIQHRYYKNNSNYYNEKTRINQCIKANFLVKAEIHDDIYTLYLISRNTNDIKEYNQAIIPNYKKSVFMNSIFRNIKENTNLDFLEESDDDDDFENISHDKFVDQEKEYIMECVYNRKFKLWEPMKIIQDKKIDFYGDIMRIEKNNR